MADLTLGSDPLQVLAAAVTPVVLVSATAILISGVNSRYMSISDKMRQLAHEFRESGCPAARKTVIGREMKTFVARVELISWAVRTLYLSVGCFICVAMIISATLWRRVLQEATVPLFLFGIALMIVAIVCQLLELQISNRTLSIEVKDIIAD